MAPATLERMLRRRDAAEGASRSFLLEIFLISGAALLLEVSYTRIISFKLYYYTYLTIGLALLGLGSGAVFMAVSARLRRTRTASSSAGAPWRRRPRSSSATSSWPRCRSTRSHCGRRAGGGEWWAWPSSC